ncbi:hypothetical protein niasHT_023911 [Heterodera trifolii]|uniref:Uncharacterized protein n=1 Tax=Heterodera trifolii TaxID=157864 RepID=A0ABD2JCK1_9BILA
MTSFLFNFGMISPCSSSSIHWPLNWRPFALFVVLFGFFTANSQMFVSASDDKRNSFGRDFLPFGKRIANSEENFQRDFMAFGKRSPNEAFQREFMAFGKRGAPSDHFQRDFMAFGKRVPDGFQREFMTFGKRSSEMGRGGSFDREFMAFGRRK